MHSDTISNSSASFCTNAINAMADYIIHSLNEVQGCDELADLLVHADHEVRAEAYQIYEGINQLKRGWFAMDSVGTSNTEGIFVLLGFLPDYCFQLLQLFQNNIS